MVHNSLEIEFACGLPGHKHTFALELRVKEIKFRVHERYRETRESREGAGEKLERAGKRRR
jgi:hypothetical protein